MALFQPTNIYPSSLGELGNGTVDITKPLNVSWQVNGNSAMSAFSITIYKNDAESTKVYETGKLTDGCPFYGTDYAGNTVFFSYTIPSESLSGAGMVNGEQYKLPRSEFRAMLHFCENPGKIQSRAELLKKMTGRELKPHDRTVDVTIRRIRKHFESTPDTPEIIATIHGEGYRFCGDLQE